MKRVLMRTYEHRYFGKPGVEFACPDEVADELIKLDKRAFKVLRDVEEKAFEKPPADKMVKGKRATKK